MKQLLLLLFIGIFLLHSAGYAQSSSATWALTKDGAPVLVGNVAANTIDTSSVSTNIVGFAGRAFTDTNFTGLAVGATGITSWPADSTTTIANSSFSGIISSTGVITTRYIDFTISPTSGNSLTIENISVKLTEGGSATNINAVLGYSTDGENFTPFNLNGLTGNPLPANISQTFTAKPLLPVNSGGTVTVRIILWRKANTAAAASTVYIGPVVISSALPVLNKAVSATWALSKNGAPVIVGNVAANTIDTSSTSTNLFGFAGHTFADTSFTGLVLGATGNTNWPADSTTSTANSSFTGIVTGTGREAKRYIQFAVSPTSGSSITINNISVLLTERGSSTNINAVLGYSTDGINFTTFNANGITGNALPANTQVAFTATPSLNLGTTGNVYVRIILWRKANSTASASSVYVGTVTISGTNDSATAINDGTLAVKNFTLEQNFPNPFNPSTVINYVIPVESKVNLKVYNSLGSEITELVNETQQAGRKSVTFNASGLPSGIYFYHLQAGSNIKTGKMILMK